MAMSLLNTLSVLAYLETEIEEGRIIVPVTKTASILNGLNRAQTFIEACEPEREGE
jgi:hypothetical protein